MKNLMRFSLAMLLFSACIQNDTPKVVLAEPKEGEEKILVLPYNAEYNEKSAKTELIHNASGDPSNLSATDMIDAINIKYPEIRLTMAKISGDTLYVKIGNASYLSQSLGTAGSNSYLAESTYSLTEIKGIKAVNFMFAEGDHASPGVYTRASFKGKVEIR